MKRLKRSSFGVLVTTYDTDGVELSQADLVQSFESIADITQIGKTKVNSTTGKIYLQMKNVESMMIQNLHATETLTLEYTDSASAYRVLKIPAGLFSIMTTIKAAAANYVIATTSATAGEVAYAISGNTPVTS